MKLIWVTADTVRKDHISTYDEHRGRITPWLDRFASEAHRFDRHYAASFPTMPARADHATGRSTMSFMDWSPLPPDTETLAQLLARSGVHTAAVVDTPFYWRHGMNYDRGFQTFHPVLGQESLSTRLTRGNRNEARDIRAEWTGEGDLPAPRTFGTAARWLEKHHREDFFLYIDTWDPHEPWDAPDYYTRLYLPDYDGRNVTPVYARIHDVPGFDADDLEIGHAMYSGELTMVDTWFGFLLTHLSNLGIADDTCVIFTTDHGFYFGEHGGLFGKLTYALRPEGDRPFYHGEPDASWGHSPLYEELISIPLLIRVPGAKPGSHQGITTAVDLMPTVLDWFQAEIPSWVEGTSLLPAIQGNVNEGRADFAVTSVPFANPGDTVDSVDNSSRALEAHLCTTITTDRWSLIYTPEPGLSELYDLNQDPYQSHNVIGEYEGEARALHQRFVEFMQQTHVPTELRRPRSELRL